MGEEVIESSDRPGSIVIIGIHTVLQHISHEFASFLSRPLPTDGPNQTFVIMAFEAGAVEYVSGTP